MTEKGLGKTNFDWSDIIGYEEVKEEAKRIAGFAKTILIRGESGTGKRIFAHAIHNEVRRGKPFVVVHCPNIQPTLFESEIFGHKKGAFTDAKEEKVGKIETAKDGTLFFDEIANVSVEIQAKLLRVIEERKFCRLGETIERETDALFIFATNKNLEGMVGEGSFLEDLYWRIEGFTLEIEPLRERKDFPVIVKGVWRKVNIKHGIYNLEPISSDEIEIISRYSFPGNIRELEKVMERVLMEILENPKCKRLEIIIKEIEKAKKKAERIMGIENEWHSKRIFKEIKEGRMSFWDLREAYLNHEINRYQLEEIISYGLKESNGSLKGVLPIFKIEEKNYKKFHDFLRHQGIKIKELTKGENKR